MLVLKHGGHTVSDNGAGTREAVGRMEHYITPKPPATTPFEYLLPYLNADGGWDPSKGVKLPNGDPIVTIRDFFAFAKLPA